MESGNSNPGSLSDWVTRAWQILVLAALYVLVGDLGLELNQLKDYTTLLAWPPAGLSLAALILFGRHLWPGIFIGSLLLGVISSYGWIVWIGTAIGHSLEAVVAVTLLGRLAGFQPTLERMKDGVAFLLIGVLGSTTIGATLGVVSLLLAGNIEVGEFAMTLLTWWLGSVGGVLILTPILLMMVHGTPSWTSLVRRFESWLVLTTLLSTSLFAFFGPDLGLVGLGVSMAPFPVLVWAGTRLGPRGAVMASSLTILIASIATGTNSGPFVSGTLAEAMFFLWAYSIFIGMAAFTLVAVVEQRDAADRKYRSGEEERLGIEKHKLLLLERERLTREMHDGIGGQLVSALSMVERGLAAPNEVAETLRRAIDHIRIVIDSLDSSTMDLPTSLGKLRARLGPLLARNGIDLRWNLEEIPDLDAFPPEAALHILRIIQEAVTNALRHANADNVEVKISSSGTSDPTGFARRRLRLRISDDGCALQPLMSSGGRGINNMKSRAEELNAVLRIEDTHPGTRIDLRIPFPR